MQPGLGDLTPPPQEYRFLYQDIGFPGAFYVKTPAAELAHCILDFVL